MTQFKVYGSHNTSVQFQATLLGSEAGVVYLFETIQKKSTKECCFVLVAWAILQLSKRDLLLAHKTHPYYMGGSTHKWYLFWAGGI